jgi:hypothetical protein
LPFALFDYFRWKNFKDDRDLSWGFGSLSFIFSLYPLEEPSHLAVVSAIMALLMAVADP